MPKGQTIGRLKVKILPDTSTFRRDTQRDLDRIEKQLLISVKAVFDDTSLKRNMLEKLRKINQENRMLDSRKIRFYTTISTLGMRDALTDAIRNFQKRVDAEGRKIKLDTRFVANNVHLELEKHTLDDLKRQINHWRKQNDPVKIGVKLDYNGASARVANARLAVLTRPRIVQIIPKINKPALAAVATTLAALSGARTITHFFDELWDSIKNLDKAAPIFATLTASVLSLGSYALIGAGNLFSLGAALASILPAALALPGIVGGMAVGVGATIAVFKDFNKVLPEVKKQLSEVQKVMSSNFWKVAKKPIQELVDGLLPKFTDGLKGTSTSLGTFFGTLASKLKGDLEPFMAGMFDDLNKSIDIAVNSTGSLSNLIATLGKVGAGYLPRLAQWFSDIMKRFSDFISAAADDGRLQQWIETGIQALKDLGGVIANVYSIFSGLANAASLAGGSTLGTLADTLGGISKAISSPAFRDDLVQVLAGAHEALREIALVSGPAVKDFFQSFADVLKHDLPIAGQVVGDLLKTIAGVLSNPVIEQGLTDLLTGFDAFVRGLGPAIAPVGEFIGKLGSVLGDFLAQLGPNFGEILATVAGAANDLLPAIDALIPSLSNMLHEAVEPLGNLLGALVDIFKALVGPMSAVFNTVGPALPFLIGAWLAFKGIKIAVSKAIDAFRTAKDIWNAGTKVAHVFGDFASGLRDSRAAASAFTGTAGTVGGVIRKIGDATVDGIKSFATFSAKAVASAAKTAAAWVASAAKVIASLAVTAAQFVAKGAMMVASMVATAAAVVAQWVLMAAQAMARAAIMAAAWLLAMGPIPIIVAAVVALVALIIANWDTIKQWTIDAWNAIWNFIKQAVQWVLDFVKDHWPLIVGIFLGPFALIVAMVIKHWDLIKSAFAAAWNAIKTGVQIAWTAITGFFSAAWSAITTGVSTAWAAIVGFFTGAWNTIKSLVQDGWDAVKQLFSDAWDALTTAVSTGIDAVVFLLIDLPQKILDAIGDLSSLLFDVGKKLIQGFINGIKSMFGAVKDTLGNLTSKLTSWKGPAPVDARILYGAGQLVINGFISGLESRYGAVKASLSSLTSDIGSMRVSAPTVGAIGVAGSADGATGGNGTTKIFNYHAAPGSSINSEEDLFTAVNRGRMVGW